ncbi:MAG: 50S ribosomal protein L5 [Candidatus Eremiobacteraeota bacterium]|nr:50S ribosomal protein L5 [Candidatus Eremiobacteraeota bacterium]
MVRLKERYKNEVVPSMKKYFNYKNKMEVPCLVKVVINMGMGEALVDGRALESASSDIATITGQKPIITRAKKSIAAFKLRAGMNVGLKVTLRGERMYVFLDKLFNVVLPRIRDFRGLSPKAFDGHGNYTIGLKEQIIFPEIDYDKVDKFRGMNITIVTSAKTDEEGAYLLREMGCPIQES